MPAYLTEPKCGRFYINSDSGNDYTTKAKSPSWLYPLDGNRFVPGKDPQHLGGDVWVADAAMAMMEKENWSGMLVTLGGIDKAGHMWGAHTDKGSAAGSPDEQTRVPYAAKLADEQFGRMLQKLRDLGQLDETLIVITADHGATHARQFYGVDAAGSAETNWYYGKAVNTEDYNKPSPALKPLIDTGNVQFSYQSTMIEVWLKDNSAEKKRAAAKVMRSSARCCGHLLARRRQVPARCRSRPRHRRPFRRRRARVVEEEWTSAGGHDGRRSWAGRDCASRR